MSHPLCLGFKQKQMDNNGAPIYLAVHGHCEWGPQREHVLRGLDLPNGVEVSSRARMNQQVMNMRDFVSSLLCTAELMFQIISGWVIFVPTLTGKKSVLLGQGCDYSSSSCCYWDGGISWSYAKSHSNAVWEFMQCNPSPKIVVCKCIFLYMRIRKTRMCEQLLFNLYPFPLP